MKKSYLFPTYFKKIGWIIVLSTLLFVLLDIILEKDLNFKFKALAIIDDSIRIGLPDKDTFFTIAETSFLTTLFPVLIIVGFVFIAFSKEKNEDEYISKIREQSLVWSVLVTCLILVIAIIFIYGTTAFYVFWLDFLLFFLVFVIKFRVEIFRFKRSIKRDEE